MENIAVLVAAAVLAVVSGLVFAAFRRHRHEWALTDSRLAAQFDDVRAERQALAEREKSIAEREQRWADLVRSLDERSERLAADEEAHEARVAEWADLEEIRKATLERIAGFTAEQAAAELIATVEDGAKREATLRAREFERVVREEAEDRARAILATSMQRLAGDLTSDSVVTVVHLPSDEMKGRIIGKEGRNIRTFEQLTGVNVLIDDTPEAVLLSCFDPVRREVARLTIEALVEDGRIHPHRIEQQYERSLAEMDRRTVEAGREALLQVGIVDMHPELVALLGALRFRTSYGQNVLKHLVESARLAGLMAAELGVDVGLAKRCALLHDIGKAVSQDVDGSHAAVGADIARRYGESADVVHAIEAHHDEVEPRTVWAVLTQTADAMSAARPGARREAPQAYVNRMGNLEQIAMSKDGVDKVFAMQAGRELRVMVVPESVDDVQAHVLARDIAKQIEEELTYPGNIRVTVIRETRASETAR